jgi:S1-C subfamily serine protease
VLVALVAAALGAGTVFALQAGSQPSDSNTGGSLSPQQIPSPGRAQSGGNTNTSGVDVHAVTAKVEPGVVDITSSLRYSGQVFEGTGMVLTSSGLVLTNNHVVDGSTGLTATIVTSGRRYTAQVVGTDATEDVALLKLTGVSGLRTVQVGDSSKVRVGTQVVAMGNAGGQGGTPTVTSGSITAVGRTITASDSGSNTSETLHNMLQTNAPIAEGDSGGPLSNAAGQVIGMDTAANTQSFGGSGTSEGFAIPINRALAIVHQIAAGHGSATIHIGQPAFMGIAVASTSSNAVSSAQTPQQQLQQLQQAAADQPGSGFSNSINSNGRCLSTGSGSPVPNPIAPASSGTLIAGAFCNAPADAAGLTGGDVILAINGRTVGAPATLTNVLGRYHPGDRVSVIWMDPGGQRHTSSLTLIAGPLK